MLSTEYHLIARVDNDGVVKNVPVQMIKGDLYNGEKRFLLKTENNSDSKNIVDVDGPAFIDNVTSRFKSEESFVKEVKSPSRILRIFIGDELTDPVKREVVWDSREISSLTSLLIEKGKDTVHIATHSKPESFKGHELINRLVKLIVAKPEYAEKFTSDKALIENIVRCEALRERWVSCSVNDISTAEMTKEAYARTNASYDVVRCLFTNLANEGNNNLFHLIRVYNGKRYIFDFNQKAFMEECGSYKPQYQRCYDIDLFTLDRLGTGGSPLDLVAQYNFIKAKPSFDYSFDPSAHKPEYYLENVDGKRFNVLYRRSIPFDIKEIIDNLDSYGYFDNSCKDENAKQTFNDLLKDWAKNTPYEILTRAHIRSKTDGPNDLAFSPNSVIDISDNQYYLTLREKIDYLVVYYSGQKPESKTHAKKVDIFGQSHAPHPKKYPY